MAWRAILKKPKLEANCSVRNDINHHRYPGLINKENGWFTILLKLR